MLNKKMNKTAYHSETADPSRRNGPIFLERERANLYATGDRQRTSCRGACAALFFHPSTFSHAASRYAPIDLASERTLLHSTAFAANFGD